MFNIREYGVTSFFLGQVGFFSIDHRVYRDIIKEHQRHSFEYTYLHFRSVFLDQKCAKKLLQADACNTQVHVNKYFPRDLKAS